MLFCYWLNINITMSHYEIAVSLSFLTTSVYTEHANVIRTTQRSSVDGPLDNPGFSTLDSTFCRLPSFLKSTFLVFCRISEQNKITCMPSWTGLPTDGSAGVSKERAVQRIWGGSFYPAARGASVAAQPSATRESSLGTLAAAFEPTQFSVPLLGLGSVPVLGPSSSVGSGSVPVAGPSSSVGSGSVPVLGPSSSVGSGSVPVPGPSSSVGSGSVPVAGPSSSVGSGSVPVLGPSSSVGSGSVPVVGPSSSVGSGSVPVLGPSSSVGSGSVPVAGPSSSVGSGSVPVPGPSSSVGSGSVSVLGPSSSVGSGSVPVPGPSSFVGSGSVPAPGPSSSADVPPQCHQRQHLLAGWHGSRWPRGLRCCTSSTWSESRKSTKLSQLLGIGLSHTWLREQEYLLFLLLDPQARCHPFLRNRVCQVGVGLGDWLSRVSCKVALMLAFGWSYVVRRGLRAIGRLLLTKGLGLSLPVLKHLVGPRCIHNLGKMFCSLGMMLRAHLIPVVHRGLHRSMICQCTLLGWLVAEAATSKRSAIIVVKRGTALVSALGGDPHSLA